jgi:IPTL-CTERM motif
MNFKSLRIAKWGLALLGALFATLVSAQSYFITFSGTPSSIACTNTNFTLGAGASYSWNLPSAGTLVNIVGTAGSTVISSGPQTLGAASGTSPLVGGASFVSTPFPYTVQYLLTPQFPGATTSGFSFLCASATGTNFTILNGGVFGNNPVPTLNKWGLLILATLLAAASVMLLRRRLARR